MVMPPAAAKVRIPLYLILLDIAGFAVIGLGFAQQLGRVDLLPSSWNQSWAGVMLMALGLAFMLPLLFYIKKAVKHARREEDQWLQTLPADIQQKMLAKLNPQSRK